MNHSVTLVITITSLAYCIIGSLVYYRGGQRTTWAPNQQQYQYGTWQNPDQDPRRRVVYQSGEDAAEFWITFFCIFCFFISFVVVIAWLSYDYYDDDYYRRDD
jgi:hypothetical protein